MYEKTAICDFCSSVDLTKHKRYEIRMSVYNAVGEGPTSSPQEVFVGEAGKNLYYLYKVFLSLKMSKTSPHIDIPSQFPLPRLKVWSSNQLLPHNLMWRGARLRWRLRMEIFRVIRSDSDDYVENAFNLLTFYD